MDLKKDRFKRRRYLDNSNNFQQYKQPKIKQKYISIFSLLYFNISLPGRLLLLLDVQDQSTLVIVPPSFDIMN